MGQKYVFSFSEQKIKKNYPGFSLIEVVVAIFFVTIAVFVVGTLSQQVINFRKSASQTGALIELKTLTSTVARNPQKWLTALKNDPDVASLYTGCLSEISTGAGYTCPTPSLNNAIIAGDTRLEEYATDMHVIDTPLVDSRGKKIAGTQAAPHYMHSDGRACLEIDTKNCALQSVGYFMRSNPATNQNPGEVRFVMKVERNATANNAKIGNLPMKAEYMSIEIGNDWSTNPSTPCPANTVQVGYLNDGALQCINPTASCTGPGEVQIGINLDGSPKCQAPATVCAAPNSFVVYDPQSGGLTCAATSPCASGTFTGYYSATGNPMCSTNPPGCTSTSSQKKVQMGQTSDGSPICANVATCTSANPKLSFDGTNFICQTDNIGSSSSANPDTPNPPSDMIVCSKNVPHSEWNRWTIHCQTLRNKQGALYHQMCMPGGEYSTSFSKADCGGRTVTPEHQGIVADVSFCNGTDTFGVIPAGAVRHKWAVVNVNVNGSVVTSSETTTGPGLYWYKNMGNGVGTCHHEDYTIGFIRVIYFKP